MVISDNFNGFWAITVQDIIIDGLSYVDKSSSKKQRLTAIIDSGSSFVSLP